MEQANLYSFCSICQNELSGNPISYSCGHKYCFTCFPFIMYNIIENNGINNEFFNKFENNQYKCILCQKGVSSIPFNLISEHIKIKYVKIEEKINSLEKQALSLCDACDREVSEKWCQECNSDYCNTCEEFYHKNHKKFKNHTTFTLAQKEEIIHKESKIFKLECKCLSKHLLEYFCLDCQSAVCKYCFKLLHENHHEILISDVLDSVNLTDLQKGKSHLKEVQSIFSEFKNNLIVSLDEKTGTHNKVFIKLCDNIINIVNELKEKNMNQSSNEYKEIQNQLSLIENSLLFLNKELENNESFKENINSIHPNKLFQIRKIIGKEKKTVETKDLSIKIGFNGNDITEDMSELKNKLQDLLKNHEENRLIQFTQDENKKTGACFGIAQNEIDKMFYKIIYCNPIELLKNNPILVERKSFFPNWWKSNVSASYTLKNQDETFLVYPGKDYQALTYPLYFYNLTLMKREMIFRTGNTSKISVVSTYPKELDNDYKSWIYTADESCVFQVYDLNLKDLTHKSFKQIYKIEESTTGKGILSAIMFDDKYSELLSEKVSDEKGIYVILSFNNIELPINLHKLNTDGGTQLIRKINNHNNETCITINFYYDDIIEKTVFFFGFTESFIKLYDLKSNSWLKQKFETKSGVTSINFILKNVNKYEKLHSEDLNNLKIIERFLIYTQNNNLIVIGNIDTGSIIRQVEIPDIEFIYDLCIWNYADSNMHHLIIATKDKNSIKILNFDDLHVVFECNEIDNSFPVNLIKLWIHNKKNKEIKESLVSLKYFGEKPICLYN